MLPRSPRAVLLLTAVLAGAGGVRGQGPDLPQEPAGRAVVASSHDALPPVPPPESAAPSVADPTPPAPRPAPPGLPDDGLAPPPPVPAKLSTPGKAPDDGLATPPPPGETPPRPVAPPADAAARQTDYPADPKASPAAPVASQGAAQVSVEVAGPPSVAPGEPLRYEIIVRNVGTAAAGRLHLEDALPPGARLLSALPPATAQADLLAWDLGTLEAGDQRRVKVELEYSGPEELFRAPRVSFSAATSLRTHIARPPLSVALTGPESVERGAKVTFRIELSNNGAAPIRHIVIRDSLPPGLQHPQGDAVEADVGELAAGQTRVIHLDVTAVQGGSFINEVVARTESGLQAISRVGLRVKDTGAAPTPESVRQAAAVVPAPAERVEARPALQVEMLARRDPVPAGEETIYLVRVVNRGDGPATNVRLVVHLPEGLTPLQADGPATVRIAQNLAVAEAVASIAPRQQVEYHVRVRGRNSGTWRLEAELAADQLQQALTEQVAVHVTDPAR